MKIKTYLQNLSYGPMADTAMAGDGSGLVKEQDIPKMMMAANAALTALYTRFRLKTRTIMLQVVEGQAEYPLRREFAQTSDSDEEYKFIQDSLVQPFLGDVLQVTDVYDSCHRPVPLNDREHKFSWFLTGYDTLTMDYARTGDLYFVEYRARHPELSLLPSPEEYEQEIRIPFQLEEALLAYAGFKLYRSMNIEHATAKAALLLSEYEQYCVAHEQRNTFGSSQESTNIKPLLGGWVR